MKRFATKSIVLAAALAAVAVGASAQSLLKAEIPFTFRAGDAVLAAGSYRVHLGPPPVRLPAVPRDFAAERHRRQPRLIHQSASRIVRPTVPHNYRSAHRRARYQHRPVLYLRIGRHKLSIRTRDFEPLDDSVLPRHSIGMREI